MKNTNGGAKGIQDMYGVIAIIIMVTGIIFSGIIAFTNDAPGFILFGTAASLGVAALLYGLSELIGHLKKISVLLSDINDKLGK